jgi:hypothetical protein
MHILKFEVEPDKRIIEIPMPSEKGKKLLVSVSGGADSAVLLYILIKANNELNLEHNIYPITVNKVDGSEIHAKKVIDWISRALTTDVKMPIIGGDHSLPHDKIVNTLLRQTFATNEYDYMYVGENKIPPIPFPFGEDNDFPGTAPQRKGNRANDPRIILPFSDFYKSHTIDLHFKLGILELLEFTHSCTERAIGRYGECWQCSERRWAFKTLNRVDRGIA